MKNELLDLAQDTMNMALKAGATAAEAMVSESRDSSISMRHGVVEELEQAESRAVGLRVFAGQSSATIATSVLTKEARQKLVERVVAMAKLAPADPYSGLAEPHQLAQQNEDFDLISKTVPSAAELKKMVEETEATGLAVKGISKCGGAGASSSSSTTALALSNGFAKSWQRTGFGLSISLVAGEGTGMVRDYYGSSANHYEDLESPAYIGAKAAERTVARVNAQKLSSQTVSVIFDRRVSASLLGHLASAINGAAVARGVTFLKEKLGQQVFNTNVTIVDDPHRMRGFSSKAFDAEGLPTQRRNFIDKGVLTSWIMDLRASRQLGLQSTASASRGLASNPSPSTSNLHMEPGTQNRDELIRTLNKGLLITEFIGNANNAATGDYSRGASGFWIENGEIQFPVSEVTVAGNLNDMFRNLTPASDLEFRSSTNAPSCMVEGMTLAGR